MGHFPQFQMSQRISMKNSRTNIETNSKITVTEFQNDKEESHELEQQNILCKTS